MTKKYRLLLINPYEKSISGYGRVKSTTLPPLGLIYLASKTPKNYHIELINEFFDELVVKDVDIVGITSFTSTISRAYKIAKLFKDKGVKVVMGGVHVTMETQEALQYCDTVVQGEAEDIWKDVLEDFENNSLKRIYNGGQVDLEFIEAPRHDLVDYSKYSWNSIQTSRGCPMGCNFCSVTLFNGKKYRRRSIQSVISELKQFNKKFVFIADDNFIGHCRKSKAWVKEFLYTIIKEKIKKYFFIQVSLNWGDDSDLLKLAYRAGIRISFVGIESVNTGTLKNYEKNLNYKYKTKNGYDGQIQNIRKHGIAVVGAFILGGDKETKDIFYETYKFIKDSHLDIIQFSLPTPLPGTKFRNDIIRDQRLIDCDYPKAWSKYGFANMLYKPKNMEIEEVYQGVCYLRMKLHSFPATVSRFLNTLIVTKSISATFIATMLNRSFRVTFMAGHIYKKYCSKHGYNKIL